MHWPVINVIILTVEHVGTFVKYNSRSKQYQFNSQLLTVLSDIMFNFFWNKPFN